MNFKYVPNSHESFPDDSYIKEIVYLEFDGKFRVAYCRKVAKNGGMFWDVVSAGATKDGSKKYFDAFMQDSAFLEKDIQAFLDSKPWSHSVKSHDEVPF